MKLTKAQREALERMPPRAWVPAREIAPFKLWDELARLELVDTHFDGDHWAYIRLTDAGRAALEAEKKS